MRKLLGLPKHASTEDSELLQSKYPYWIISYLGLLWMLVGKGVCEDGLIVTGVSSVEDYFVVLSEDGIIPEPVTDGYCVLL